MTDPLLPPLPVIENAEVRHVPGFPGYAVSNDGRVWSCKAGGRWGTMKSEWFSLTPGISIRGGYPVIALSHQGKPKTYPVHILVLLVFRGPRPHGMQGRHLNGNPKDANLSNLTYGTPKENAADRRKHGREIRGEEKANSKLSSMLIQYARDCIKSGISQTKTAKSMGISQSTLSRALSGSRSSWNHLQT